MHSKKDDKFVILELNDTAIGLVHAHAKEDMEVLPYSIGKRETDYDTLSVYA